MRIRSFQDSDLDALISLLGRGIALLPRDPHLRDPGVPDALARQTVRRAREENDSWSKGIFVAEWGGSIRGLLSALPGRDPKIGLVRWLAVEEGTGAMKQSRALLERGIEFLRARGCSVAQLSAWMDARHKPPADALLSEGFQRHDPFRSSILMACSLENLPPVPPLPEGYSAHGFRPGDEGRWLSVKNLIFETHDAPGTFEKLYSGRTTFHPDEVVFVEYAGEVVAISAGVDHRVPTGDQTFPEAYLDWVGVRSEHRGRHLGDFICLTCMHYLRRQGHSICTLITQPYRVAAVRLYQKLGFQTVGEQGVFEKAL